MIQAFQPSNSKSEIVRLRASTVSSAEPLTTRSPQFEMLTVIGLR